MCPQVGYGKPWSLARRWVAAVLPCFWAPSGHGRGLHWIRQLQQSFGSSVLSWSLTQLTFYLMGPTWWTVDLLKRVCQMQMGVSCKFWHRPFYLSLSCTDLFISSDIPLLLSVPCCSPDVFEKSQALLVDELGRCSLLGLHLYNFHPGSSLGSITTEQCVEKIAGAINHAHQQIPAVVTGTGGGQNNTNS